ncbi:aminoglycoside phosphotransferase family protein [Streptomyces sp. LP05-1]|uniref:Aminoglycoside phosphotransferase family protein n=1 Tax=Streptomyces pyxinae TaxID=2970734 RepID=A0ABT2CFN0_9ACTN|nr:aminoglycoside phosphotransferase family protein [Streptomyces sp. LP05-1]MCS0636223.1 aminoglycoside phosphotransferase family protein [Streptomyces sp. LP05-1]
MPPESATPLHRELAAVAREAAHLSRPHHPCPACAAPPRTRGPAGTLTPPEPAVLADRPDGTVVRHGAAVAKAHAPGTGGPDHRVRLAVAGHPRLAGVLLPPLAPEDPPVGAPRDRPVSVWPYGTPVDPDDPAAAPWEAAGTLLARLHSVPPGALPGPLPPMRGPAKAARAMARLAAAGDRLPAAAPVRAAWRRLPGWARGEAPAPGPAALCHGDFHLGQLVRHPVPGGPWLLIDVDDLGTGDPAWDLARPAAWYATGLLAPADWARFLGAYRAAGGPAVPPGDDSDPWPRLDAPARALTVQTAALAVAKCAAAGRAPDDAEAAMVDACARIAELPARSAPSSPT